MKFLSFKISVRCLSFDGAPLTINILHIQCERLKSKLSCEVNKLVVVILVYCWSVFSYLYCWVCSIIIYSALCCISWILEWTVCLVYNVNLASILLQIYDLSICPLVMSKVKTFLCLQLYFELFNLF